MFKIIRAAITPGTHPKKVRIRTIKIDPQPLSRTAKGGRIMDNSTRQKLKMYFLKCYKGQYKILIGKYNFLFLIGHHSKCKTGTCQHYLLSISKTIVSLPTIFNIIQTIQICNYQNKKLYEENP